MKKWPSNLQNLITYFGRLPGVGPKMAERIVLALIRRPKEEIDQFASTLASIASGTKRCSTCFTLSTAELCEICSDNTRDKAILLIVADPVSAFNIEQSGNFNGLYYVLGGLINPIEGVTPEKLRVKQLVARIGKDDTLKEVIFAFNQNLEGEATLLYLKKLLAETRNLTFSRLARGISTGADLAYADDLTLASAVTERQKLS